MANNAVLAVYSGKAFTGVFTHPTFAPAGIQISGVGEGGLERIAFRPTTSQLSMKTGMDGSTQPSLNPGYIGEIDLEVFQTSSIYQQMLNVYNGCKAASDQGDASQWALGQFFGILNTTQTKYNANGVGISKGFEVNFETDAGTIRITLMCANINQSN